MLQPGREHHLYTLHKKVFLKNNNDTIIKKIQNLEAVWLKKMLDSSKPGQASLEELGNVFRDSVDTEVKLYESVL